MKTMYRVTIYGFICDVWDQTKFTDDELINLPFGKGLDYGSTSIGDYGTFEALEEALAAFETAKQDVYPVSCEQTNIKNHYSISSPTGWALRSYFFEKRKNLYRYGIYKARQLAENCRLRDGRSG